MGTKATLIIEIVHGQYVLYVTNHVLSEDEQYMFKQTISSFN